MFYNFALVINHKDIIDIYCFLHQSLLYISPALSQFGLGGCSFPLNFTIECESTKRLQTLYSCFYCVEATHYLLINQDQPLQPIDSFLYVGSVVETKMSRSYF